MANKKTQKLALGGMLAALVMLFTYIIRIPVPATGGYVHLGDGMIFLAAALLGPYAALIGGIGSAMTDLVGGYFIYVLPTFIIKGAMGAIAGILMNQKALFRNVLVFVLAELVMVGGYFLFEGILYGWATAVLAVMPNVIQGVFGVIIGILLLPATRLQPLSRQAGK